MDGLITVLVPKDNLEIDFKGLKNAYLSELTMQIPEIYLKKIIIR